MNFRRRDRAKLSDAALIQAYLAGDLAAFETLYYRYRLLLYGFLNRRFAGDPDCVDDIFQQSWIRAVERLDTYCDCEKFGAWLMCIARNCGIDMLRAARRREAREWSRADDTIDALPEPADENGSGDGWRLVCERERESRLRGALAKLSAPQREVVTLRLAGWDFKSIAALQKCPLSTALARCEYARKNLQKDLNREI